MSDREIVFWILLYEALGVLAVFGWVVGACMEIRREKKQQKRIEDIMAGRD